MRINKSKDKEILYATIKIKKIISLYKSSNITIPITKLFIAEIKQNNTTKSFNDKKLRSLMIKLVRQVK